MHTLATNSRLFPRTICRPHSGDLLRAAAVLTALLAVAPAQQQFLEQGADLDSGRRVATGDVDGDGDVDLVFGGFQNRLFQNDGRGHFVDVSATHLPPGGGFANGLALADVDGDGDLDLVGVDNASGQTRLYRNDGSGAFSDATAQSMPVGGGFEPVLGDVDGDGDLDLVMPAVSGPCSPQNRLLLNDGSGNFTDVTSAQMPASAQHTVSIQLGDVDGDGDLDMACANKTVSYCAGGLGIHGLYLNDGAGNFTDATATHMPGTFVNVSIQVAMGDVDGDGDLDLVFGDTAQNTLYRNDGSGVFTDVSATNMPAGGGLGSLTLGDVDEDGDLDLVLADFAFPGLFPVPVGAQNLLSENDGAGVFSDVTAARMSSGSRITRAVALADLDSDGDLDIVSANDGSSRVDLNLLRQIDASIAPAIGQSYTLDVYARYGAWRAFDAALPYLSLAPASVAVPGLGTIGIDITQAAPLPPLLIPQPAGIASTSFLIPNNAALVGVELFAQAAHVPFPQPARLTNATRGVVQ